MQEIPKSWKPRIDWLKAQADKAYGWNLRLGYYEVRNRWYPPVTVPASYNLRKAFDHQHLWKKNFPNLEHNLMMKAWPRLMPQTRDKIGNFFKGCNIDHFELLDHGGRAMVFRAMNEKGRIRIARLEADHPNRSTRPLHRTVLPAYMSNEHRLDEYERIKLEVLAEVVPLHKLPGRPPSTAEQTLRDSFHDAVTDISTGTNLTYDETMFDQDTSPQNVALLPDGRIATMDPEFVYGDEARMGHSLLAQQFKPRNWGLIAAQKLVYGPTPDRVFF